MARSLLNRLKDTKELRNNITKQIDNLEEEGFDAVQDMNAAGTSESTLAEERARGKKLKSLRLRLKTLNNSINKITEDLKDKVKPTKSKKAKLKTLSKRGSGGGAMFDLTRRTGKSLLQLMSKRPNI